MWEGPIAGPEGTLHFYHVPYHTSKLQAVTLGCTGCLVRASFPHVDFCGGGVFQGTRISGRVEGRGGGRKRRGVLLTEDTQVGGRVLLGRTSQGGVRGGGGGIGGKVVREGAGASEAIGGHSWGIGGHKILSVDDEFPAGIQLDDYLRGIRSKEGESKERAEERERERREKNGSERRGYMRASA